MAVTKDERDAMIKAAHLALADALTPLMATGAMLGIGVFALLKIEEGDIARIAAISETTPNGETEVLKFLSDIVSGVQPLTEEWHDMKPPTRQ